MTAFIVTGLQDRKADKTIKKRRLVVEASNEYTAQNMAKTHCEGYFQYGPLWSIVVHEVGTVRSFDEFSE